MGVDVILAQLGSGHVARGDALPVGHVGNDFRPEGDRAFFIPWLYLVAPPLAEQSCRRLMQRAEGEELDRAVGDTGAVEAREIPEKRDFPDEVARECREVVAMIIKELDRAIRPDRVDVEVGEHLLGALESAIAKRTTEIVSRPSIGRSRTACSMAARRCCPSLIRIVASIEILRRPTVRKGPAAAAGSNSISPSTEAQREERMYSSGLLTI